MRLFEAARWAPSGGNLQPWRFVYALRGTDAFSATVDVLLPFNHEWATRAAALITLCAVTSFDGSKPVPSHSFDAGAAWMSLALQAHDMGLSAHAMGGFSREKAAVTFELPEFWRPEVVIAIGYPGDVASLPPALQAREFPSSRHAVADMVFEGKVQV